MLQLLGLDSLMQMESRHYFKWEKCTSRRIIAHRASSFKYVSSVLFNSISDIVLEALITVGRDIIIFVVRTCRDQVDELTSLNISSIDLQ